MSSPKTGKPVAMARTEDDSWDITESVGATALGVAWARAEETTSDCPLFTDPYARLFVDAAMERGWRLPPEYMLERIRAISGYAASRTRWPQRILRCGRRQRHRTSRHPRGRPGRPGLAATVVGRDGSL